MQAISDEGLEELIAAFGEPGANPTTTEAQPIVEAEVEVIAPKETYEQWKARREIEMVQEYIASQEKAAIPTTTEPIVEEVVEEPTTEKSVEGEIKVIAPPIVEVEAAAPTKVSKGKSKDGLFVKTGIGMLQGTLIKDLGAPCFTTLMVISSYMDNRGVCFPGQETIAEITGISRETVNRHIKILLNYRTPEGSPILQSKKIKVPGMPYARASYVILPASGLSFG